MRRAAFFSSVALAALGLWLHAQELSLPLKPNSVRFAVIGDMGNGLKVQYEVAGKLNEYHQKFAFEFVMMVGDDLIGGDAPADYVSKFERAYKPLLDAGVKFYAVLGNHDKPNERLYKPELRLVLEPLFVKYGVQVVFAGHEHIYERLKPQKGIYYFTEGASGELRPGDLRKSALTAAGYDQDRSFMLVEIAGDELCFQTISRTGQTVDSGVIQRAVATSGVTSWPAEVSGVPIALAWNRR